MKKRLMAAIVLAIIALLAVLGATVGASAASAAVPSNARAKTAVKKEIRLRWPVTGWPVTKASGLDGKKETISCARLSRVYFKCSFKSVVAGTSEDTGELIHLVTYTGRAKIRFYPRGADATFYQVRCDDDGLGVFC